MNEEKMKQAAGQDMLNLPCIFEDITDMGGRAAQCWQHDRKCAIKSVDLLVVGASCKDMSRANVNQRQFVLTQATSRGGSAQTFHGLLAYVSQSTGHWSSCLKMSTPWTTRAAAPGETSTAQQP